MTDNKIQDWNDIPEYKNREAVWPRIFAEYQISEELLDEFLTTAEKVYNALPGDVPLTAEKYFLHTETVTDDAENLKEDLQLDDCCKVIAMNQVFSPKLLMKHSHVLDYNDLRLNIRIQDQWGDDLADVYRYAGIANQVLSETASTLHSAEDVFRMAANNEVVGVLEDMDSQMTEYFLANYTWTNSELPYFLIYLPVQEDTYEAIYHLYQDRDFRYDVMYNIIMYQKPSEAFLERYYDQLPLEQLCRSSTKLSEDFLERHFDSLNKCSSFDKQFTGNPNISDEFIQKHKEQFQYYVWETIAKSYPFKSTDSVIKHADMLQNYVWELRRNPVLENYDKNEIQLLINKGLQKSEAILFEQEVVPFLDEVKAELLDIIQNSKYSSNDKLAIVDNFKEAAQTYLINSQKAVEISKAR